MRLGFRTGWAIAALVGAPIVACVGTPFSSSAGASSSTGSTGSAGKSTSTSTGGGATGGSSGATSGTGGTASSTMQASTGTGPTCMPPLMQCGNQCVDVSGTDPKNCGSCGNACAVGDMCSGGKCMCAGGGLDCDGGCVNGAFDPGNCGACGDGCDHTQACAGSVCGCRPPLVAMFGGCYDTTHDPKHCGPKNQICAAGQVCGIPTTLASGCMSKTVCQVAGGTPCTNGGCYTTTELASDPFNCGGCGSVCAPTQLCVQGNCRSYTVPENCGPATCSGGSMCCSFPGNQNNIICLDDSSCG